MVSVNMRIKLILLALMFMVVSCTSMTPRYSLYDDRSEYDENHVALLQIPDTIQFLSFDDKVPSHNIRYPDSFQSTLKHPYREVLIKPGVHYIMFQHHRRGLLKLSESTSVQVMQRAPFMAAFEAKPGYTYRLQTRGFVRGRYFYGWIENIPELMARHEVEMSFNFNEQFRYWYEQDWRIVAAGVTLDDNGKPQYQEIYARSKHSILKDVVKGAEMPPRETYWPTIEDAVAASKAGVEKLRSYISIK